MNRRTTWTLAIAALAMFAYIIFFERHSLNSTETAARAGLVFPGLEISRITGVEIVRTNERVLVERSGLGWQLAQPRYPAQAATIDSFVAAVTQMRRQAEISAREYRSVTNGLAAFGLDPPRATVGLLEGTNRMRFHLGSKTPLGNSVYLQRIGSATVEVADGALLDFLPETVNDWRSRRLIEVDGQTFNRLTVQNGARVTEIERDSTNPLWRLARPMRARADVQRVRLFLQYLLTSQVERFVTDDPRSDLEGYGLQSPEAEVSLAQGTNVVAQLRFGNSPTNEPNRVYARLMNHGNVVLAPRELMDLLREPYTFFRDRTLFGFQLDAVTRVDAAAAEAFSIQKQTNGLWQIVAPSPAPADAELVQNFLGQLAGLEVVDFFKDVAVAADFVTAGLEPPARQYVLKAAVTNAGTITNVVLGQLGFSRTDTSRVDRVFARRSDESSIYTVSYGDLLQLPDAAFRLRDRQIWNFAATNIVRFTVTESGRKTTHERKPGGKWHPDEVANEAIEETLHRFSQLRAQEWVDRGEERRKGFFRDDSLHIEIETLLGGATETYVVDVSRKLAPSGHPYASIRFGNEPVIFKFPAPLFAELISSLNIPTAGPGAVAQ